MTTTADVRHDMPAPAAAVQSFVSDRALQARWNFYQAPAATVPTAKIQETGPGSMGWRKQVKLNDE